jgi:pilus assembly protein CpaF
MGTGLENAVGVIDRVTRAIAIGDTSLAPDAIEAQARRLLRSESPWRVEESVERVVDSVLRLGPLQPLLEDPDTSDILVNGPEEVWVDRGGVLELTNIRFSSAEEMVATVERVIAPLGLRIDRSAPMVDARLSDGSRLHAVLPPASVDVPLIAIRRFTQKVQTLEDLVAVGSATKEEVAVMEAAVRDRRTIVISGGTGAGKTTLLNLLAALIPASERVVTIED